MTDSIISLSGVHLAPGIRRVTPRTANAIKGISSHPNHQRLILKEMSKFFKTGSLKISCVKIMASRGVNIAPALSTMPFITARVSIESSESPAVEAPIKCITTSTITIGRNAHNRNTISFFVFIMVVQIPIYPLMLNFCCKISHLR